MNDEKIVCMDCGRTIHTDELDPSFKTVGIGEGACFVFYTVECPECGHLFTKTVRYDYAGTYYDEE